jgi:hypothetical protein
VRLGREREREIRRREERDWNNNLNNNDNNNNNRKICLTDWRLRESKMMIPPKNSDFQRQLIIKPWFNDSNNNEDDRNIYHRLMYPT